MAHRRRRRAARHRRARVPRHAADRVRAADALWRRAERGRHDRWNARHADNGRHDDDRQRPRRTRQLSEARGALFLLRADVRDRRAARSVARRVAHGRREGAARARESRSAGAADRSHDQVQHDRPRPGRGAHRRRAQRDRRGAARRQGDRHEPRSASRRNGGRGQRRLSRHGHRIALSQHPRAARSRARADRRRDAARGGRGRPPARRPRQPRRGASR